MNVLEKILEEILQYRKDNNLYAGKQVTEIERIIRSHMNDVPDMNVGEWIPVSEQLPEDDLFVLVTVGGIYNYITFSTAIQLAFYINERWFIVGYPELDNQDVIAWMELPGPYKTEEEG